jgi:hypothetical protein
MNIEPNQPAIKNLTAKESCDRAWSYYQHADNLLSGRSNLILVAEAMLIGGFVALPQDDIFLRIWLICLALAYTTGWWYVNARLQKRIRTFIADLKRDPIYLKFVDSVGGISAGAVLTTIIPATTFIFWFGLLIYQVWKLI